MPSGMAGRCRFKRWQELLMPSVDSKLASLLMCTMVLPHMEHIDQQVINVIHSVSSIMYTQVYIMCVHITLKIIVYSIMYIKGVLLCVDMVDIDVQRC